MKKYLKLEVTICDRKIFIESIAFLGTVNKFV